MTRLARVAFALLVLLAGASPALAAGPELGARLSPTMLVYEHEQSFSVSNRSTLPVLVHLEALGDGWKIGLTDTRLGVNERVDVPVTAAGSGDVVFRATMRAETLPEGMDASALVLETRGRHLAPWEQIDGPWWLLLALVVLVACGAVLRRLRRSAAD